MNKLDAHMIAQLHKLAIEYDMPSIDTIASRMQVLAKSAHKTNAFPQ